MPGVLTTSAFLRPLSVAVAAATIAVLLPASAVHATLGATTSWDTTSMVSGDPSPFDLVSGPDGNLWITFPGADAVVRFGPGGSVVNTYSTGSGCHPTGIAIGPDANIWVACFYGDRLLRITSDGTVTPFALPGTAASVAAGGHGPALLVSGPDGYLWFTEGKDGYVSKLNVHTGGLWEYPVPSGRGAELRGITVGSDGNLWFTEYAANKVGRVTPKGSVAEIAIPTAGSGPFGISAGPNNTLFFAESSGYKIGELDPSSGSIYEYRLFIPGPLPQPLMTAVGPDGNVWFTDKGSSQIGSTLGQAFSADPNSSPAGVADGPDGNLWYTEQGAHKLVRIDVRDEALATDRTGVSFGNVKEGTTTTPQLVTLGNYSGTLRFLSMSVDNVDPAVGAFFTNSSNCDYLLTVPSSACQVQVWFVANGVPGTDSATMTFYVYLQPAAPITPPDLQVLTVDLTATVVANQCTTASIATDVSSPQQAGATVNVSATAGGCPNPSPLYRFYTRSPEGVWSIARDYDTASTFSWDTAGLEPGTYELGVWVLQAKGVAAYDAYALTTYVITVPSCSSVTLNSDLGSPQAAGPTVNFTAVAAGCAAPVYQWWVRDRSGAWSVVPGRDFAHSSATLGWSTAGLPAGTYQVGVWAKDASSNASYDTYAFTTFTLNPAVAGTACQSAGVSASPVSPSSAGSNVTFTASSTGCANPEYRWWIRDLQGSWSSFGSYSAVTSLVWPAGSPGVYLVGVWARQAGSAASYEAYAIVTQILIPAAAPCSSVSLTPGVLSPQPIGTSITFTPNATGCLSPEYRFFVAPPGGVFSPVQAYGADTSFTWNTAGLTAGTYQIGVWARQSGTAVAYDAYGITTYQVQIPASDTPMTLLVLWPSVTSGGNNLPSSSLPQPLGSLIYWMAGQLPPGEVQFSVEGPGASWTVVQPYGASATFPWHTAGLAPGIYKIKVEARYVGEGTPEIVALSDYMLS